MSVKEKEATAKQTFTKEQVWQKYYVTYMREWRKMYLQQNSKDMNSLNVLKKVSLDYYNKCTIITYVISPGRGTAQAVLLESRFTHIIFP